MDAQQLSTRQAYDAMFLFLNEYWERGNRSDDGLAGLLSNCQIGLWSGGTFDEPVTADPAMWQDWKDAIGRVVQGEDAHKGVREAPPADGVDS